LELKTIEILKKRCFSDYYNLLIYRCFDAFGIGANDVANSFSTAVNSGKYLNNIKIDIYDRESSSFIGQW